VRYGSVGEKQLPMMADKLEGLVSLAHVASRRKVYLLRQRANAIEVMVVSTKRPHASMRAQMPAARALSHLYLEDSEVRLRAELRGSSVEVTVVAGPAGVQLRAATPARGSTASAGTALPATAAADLPMPLLTASPGGAPGDASGDSARPQQLGGWRLLADARSGAMVIASPTLSCIVTRSMGAPRGPRSVPPSRGLFQCVTSDGPETPLAVALAGATVAVCYADRQGFATYWLTRGRTLLKLEHKRSVLLAQELEP